MTHYEIVKADLKKNPRTWLITGVAGFIGSNLLETLLQLDQTVVGLDNFATGHQHNLDDVQQCVTADQWNRFTFFEGDIRNLDDCRKAFASGAGITNEKGEANAVGKIDYVLHQAALGSVPRSLDDPIATNQANIDGFLNMLVAARDAEVKSFTYAASSSTYGDHPDLPKVEHKIGKPLSPYAVTKYVNELYADVFARSYGFNTIGLRYFNVFGKRQDPNGAYAAVIPKWVAAMIKNETVYINGDGETSRDFCYIDNAVQANILAATTEEPDALNQVYNVAVGDRTSLNLLYDLIKQQLVADELGDTSKAPISEACEGMRPVYRDFRAGDVRHSQASVDKAASLLGYQPTQTIREGVCLAMPWYLKNG